MDALKPKLDDLKTHLRRLGSVVVAYSGGVDSALLLKVAHDVLGDRAVAVTAVSPSQPARETKAAQTLAEQIGAPMVAFESREIDDPAYVANTPQRCYVCKGYILDQLLAYADAHGYRHVVEGSNADDEGDFRPGARAVAERDVRSPLQEAGLIKADVRALARQLGLPNWDKPSAACLASRIPYGTPITPERLDQIERAEQALDELGVAQLRVRHHDEVARIEVEPGDFETVLAQCEWIVERLKALGFSYVTLDLAGFRSGSMNEVI